MVVDFISRTKKVEKGTKTCTMVKMSLQFWNGIRWEAENRTGIDKGK